MSRVTGSDKKPISTLWDLVKGDVVMLALDSAVSLSISTVALDAIRDGNRPEAAICCVVAVGATYFANDHFRKIKKALSRLPAPKVG